MALAGLIADAIRYNPGTRRSLLEAGVTSVRSLGDEYAWIEEALKAATVRAAAALRTDRIGVVAPGRAADLVVVDGEPHRDIGAVRRVTVVLRDGRVVVDYRAER